MIYQVCSVFDRAASAYGRPVFGVAVGAIVRGFTDEVNRQAEDNSMYQHPGDYELFHLGVFEDATARFELFDAPRLLVSAESVKLFRRAG